MTHAGNNEPSLSALRDSARDVITTSLGFTDGDISAMFGVAPHDVAGSYMPMVGPKYSMYVGWTAGERERCALARAFLGMGADESVSPADVEDALGELVNILGGGVKRRMLAQVPQLVVGLPFFAGGRMRLLGGVDGLAGGCAAGRRVAHRLLRPDAGVNHGGGSGRSELRCLQLFDFNSC